MEEAPEGLTYNDTEENGWKSTKEMWLESLGYDAEAGFIPKSIVDKTDKTELKATTTEADDAGLGEGAAAPIPSWTLHGGFPSP